MRLIYYVSPLVVALRQKKQLERQINFLIFYEGEKELKEQQEEEQILLQREEHQEEQQEQEAKDNAKPVSANAKPKNGKPARIASSENKN